MMLVTREGQPESISPQGFLELSADIAYRLSGTIFDPRSLLDIIFLGIDPPSWDESLLVRAIATAHTGYGDRRRKLGPLAVIHPIRTAAILARITRNPTALDMLGAMLHDKDEDLTREIIGQEQWSRMSTEMDQLIRMLDSDNQWFLNERLDRITHRKNEHYCAYLMRILKESDAMPDLLRVKIADRLDNTLDIGVIRHGIPGRGIFGVIFDALFIQEYIGIHVPSRYVPLSEAEGTQILANLFKNTQFLSLLRTHKRPLTGSANKLCDALIMASLRIAQFVVHDAFATGLSRDNQVSIIREVLDYCTNGGLQAIKRGGTHPLDGLFLDKYEPLEGRKIRLTEVFNNKKLFARVGLVFVAVFSSFLHNPAYHIEGIDQKGVWAVD